MLTLVDPWKLISSSSINQLIACKLFSCYKPVVRKSKSHRINILKLRILTKGIQYLQIKLFYKFHQKFNIEYRNLCLMFIIYEMGINLVIKIILIHILKSNPQQFLNHNYSWLCILVFCTLKVLREKFTLELVYDRCIP